jgi:hypothetical protein
MTSLTSTVRTSLLTGALTIALAASVAAAPQRGGHGGGGHMGGGGHVGSGHSWGGGPGNAGGPRGHIGGPRGHIVIGGGLFYDPFWGPYYPYGYGYPYPWAYGNPYWQYDNSPDAGSVKTEVTPKNTEVFVDGYFAGTVDDFDGAFQRLHTAVGGHTITLHLDGYRTVTQNVYVAPDSTVKVKEAMEKLAPGEISAPVQVPAVQTRSSEGATPSPDSGSVPRE